MWFQFAQRYPYASPSEQRQFKGILRFFKSWKFQTNKLLFCNKLERHSSFSCLLASLHAAWILKSAMEEMVSIPESDAVATTIVRPLELTKHTLVLPACSLCFHFMTTEEFSSWNIWFSMSLGNRKAKHLSTVSCVSSGNGCV